MNSKAEYLELIRAAVSAYTPERIRIYIEDVRRDGLKEHGFPRLAASLGQLAAHGICPEYRDLFGEMMDITCREFQIAFLRDLPSCIGWRPRIGNDFAVREIVCALLAAEKAELFPKERTEEWRERITSLKPLDTYTCIAPTPPVCTGNWAAFAAASEQFRIYAGLGGDRDFVENQIQSQLFAFDENGMYLDLPGQPSVYDITARLQLGTALAFGYDGPGRERLEEYLLKSADATLRMQAISGEMPFGGRSNQFLHNETTFAALYEFYAHWLRDRGDPGTAGQFRCAARMARESIRPWLTGEIHHIKNRYPLESLYGCEGYGYFNKYMITMGSFAYLAWLHADDSIEEVPSPVFSGQSVFRTSERFHRLFLVAGDWSAQFDMNAETGYDCSGLGKLQKRGMPPTLCLSVPFTVSPGYTIPAENPSPLSLSAAVLRGGIPFIPQEWTVLCAESDGKAGTAVLESIGDTRLRTTLVLDGDSARLSADGDGAVLTVPVFETDGSEETVITKDEGAFSVTYQGHTARYAAGGTVTDTGLRYYNRNGQYRLFTVSDPASVTITMT